MCRLKDDKEEVLIETEDPIQTFSLYQDTIVFMTLNKDRGGIIYRANKDGSNCIELTSERGGAMVSNMIVYEGFAYVCQADYEPTEVEDGLIQYNHGYKINIDTGEWEEWEPFLNIISVDDGWIYYRNDELFFSMVPKKEDHYETWFGKIKADGSSEAVELQFPDGNDVWTIEDGWWYYIDKQGTLTRVKEDGSETQELYEQVNFAYGIINGDLYFKTGENKDAGLNYHLYQMDLETMETIELI